MKNVNFTEHTWTEVRKLVAAADKELAQIIVSCPIILHLQR